MEHLSEETIKRATLAFMKTYYKFRPRSGETIVSYDRRLNSGIPVDGYLEFPKDDGKPFTATFEVTSRQSIDEVYYTLQLDRLRWDAIATGSLLTALTVGFLWFTDIWSVFKGGWTFSFAIVVLLLLVLVVGYTMFFRSKRRYRSIKAIERFLQYHADEQWVALGHDVFPNSLDPNFTELRNQCVSNGFGLVVVDRDEHVNLLITPAREDVFGRKRVVAQYLEPTVAFNWRQNVEKYRHSYMPQILTCALSLVLLSGVFVRQWQTSQETEYVGTELGYQEELEKHKGAYVGEVPDRTELDANAVPVQHSEPLASTETTPSVSDASNFDKNEVGLYVYTPTDGYLIYDCARASVRGTKYVVQDQVCATFDEARRRIALLKTYGLIANCISFSCTIEGNAGFCVYFEFMYNDETAAHRKGAQIQKELASLHLPYDFIKIRTLKF